MKSASIHKSTLRNALKTAALAARRKAFRKGYPVAISRNGKVIFIYKDNTEVIVESPTKKSTVK